MDSVSRENQAEAFLRSSLTGPLRGEGDFVILKEGRVKGFVARAFIGDGLLRFFNRISESLSLGWMSPIKRSPGSLSAFACYLEGGREMEVYIKARHYSGLATIRAVFRRTKPLRAWLAANALEARSIPTPTPVAYIRISKGPLKYTDFFISTWVRDALNVEAYVRETFGPAPPRGMDLARRWLLKELALLLVGLHGRGIFHGDLKASNILVRKGAAGGAEFLLIDLDGIRHVSRVSPRQRVKDLARLNAALCHLFSVKERLYFFHQYCVNGGGLVEGRRGNLRHIARLTEKKVIAKREALARDEPAAN